MTLTGVVQNNMVVLKPGERLPDGAEVEVRVVRQPAPRDAAFARVRASRIARPVGIDEVIEEEKRQREERLDSWPKPSSVS
jgi:hypothetical protein